MALSTATEGVLVTMAYGVEPERMPRRAEWSRDAVRQVASHQLGLITSAQLASLSVPRSTIAWSEQVGGMFTWVLPGVHRFEGSGPLSRDQENLGSVLYAGFGSMLSGARALELFGVRAARRRSFGGDQRGLVLVPHERKRSSREFVRIERTLWLPEPRTVGHVPVAPPARAVLDAARACTVEEDVRALIFEVVQRGITTPEALSDERIRGQIRGSRFARLALEEVFAGARSVPEGDLRRAFEARGVLGLLYNPRIYLPDDSFLCSPDAYDPLTGTALEVDSREHHFSVESWEATMRRHARMTAAGLAALHAPPSRIDRDADAVVDEFCRTQTARIGWVPTVRVEPARSAA
jgi:hypothetical protein